MDIRLPKLGEGAESGTVVSIFVKEGDTLTKGQTILELENEKAVAPIPSPAAGQVQKLRVKEGDKISVGQIIAVLEGAAGMPEKTTATAEKKAAARVDVEEDEPEAAEPEASESAGPLAAAPSIRRIARELGIDLRRIRGSEHGGRIVMADLRAYIARLQRLATQPSKDKSKVVPAPVESIDFSQWGQISKRPMSPLRKTISQRLTENWNAIPHVTQFEEIDITDLNELRKKFSPAYEKRGARLTLTSFALRAVTAALKKHPIFNASLDEAREEIVHKEYFHIGLAVDTDQGLIVPVIRDVDKKNLFEVSKDVAEVAEKARSRKVSREELQGGTFTISNQGGIGGAHFTPIINRPEVAILGLGRGALKPVIRDGKIEPRLLMPIGLSYDHRLIDGGSAARFVVDLAQAFQDFKEQDVKL